jgi:hypothetical protein
MQPGKRVAIAVTALVTMGFPFDDELEHLPLKPPENGRGSKDNSFAGEKATIAGSPLQVDDVRLP